MPVYTDSPEVVRTLLPELTGGTSPGDAPAPLRELFDRLALPSARLTRLDAAPAAWPHVVVARHAGSSQFDAVIAALRTTPLPDRLICLAASGTGFHGFRGRAWSAQRGNIHLTVHLRPERPIARAESALTALAAVAAAQAVDSVRGLEDVARIKWVNDVLVYGAKVAGVLVHTQTLGERVTSVVLGIGLNVEARPRVERSPYVPAAACLRDFSDARLPAVLSALLASLHAQWEVLLSDGPARVLQAYRARSAVLDRTVEIREEGDDGTQPVIAAGRVTGIGDGLELYLEGRPEPVRRGRLRVPLS